jgi:hypothetical protein
VDSGECEGDVLAELCADSEFPSPEGWAGFESFASRLLRIFFLSQRYVSLRVTAGAGWLHNLSTTSN